MQSLAPFLFEATIKVYYFFKSTHSSNLTQIIGACFLCKLYNLVSTNFLKPDILYSFNQMNMQLKNVEKNELSLLDIKIILSIIYVLG